MTLNEKLRMLRKEKGLTQDQLAKNLGVVTRGYQRLEADAKPQYSTLLAIAEFYGISVDYLMGRTEKREVNR